MMRDHDRHLRIHVLLILSISVILSLTSCTEYPVNPPKEPAPDPQVVVRHLHTDYLSVTETGSELITNKVNLLTFQIIPQNIDCRALEFCGRVILQGPPVQQEHVLHFRTDQAIDDTGDIDVKPNIIEWIDAGLTITLFRIKYPTNEYAPFKDDQGKILSIEIHDAWMIDDLDERTPVPVVLELN